MDALHERGLAVNIATLGSYLFAAERLRALGEVTGTLSGLDVRNLQPRLNALRRVAEKTRAAAGSGNRHPGLRRDDERGLQAGGDHPPENRATSHPVTLP